MSLIVLEILSVEKELGITPLPLSAEFSPFLILLMVELVCAGFATRPRSARRLRDKKRDNRRGWYDFPR